MTPTERRFLSITRSSLLDAAAVRPRASLSRFEVLAEGPELGALGVVRTSAAFAARFDAQATSSGLALDFRQKSLAEVIRQCRHCGQEAGPYDRQCPNCRLSLETTEQAEADAARRDEARTEMWEAQIRAGTIPEARFARVLEARGISLRPWRLQTFASDRWTTG